MEHGEGTHFVGAVESVEQTECSHIGTGLFVVVVSAVMVVAAAAEVAVGKVK